MDEEIPTHLTRLSTPGNCLITAPSGGGKTYLVTKILQNRESLFDQSVEGIDWYYLEGSSLPRSDLPDANFIEGPPRLDSYIPGKGLRILVIDDMLSKIDDELVNFFLRGSHHRNLMIFFLTQNLFNKKLREMSLNSQRVIVLKNPRGLAQTKYFCQQIDPTHWKSIYQSYLDATSDKPFSYLMFDFSPKTPEYYRYRTGILPGERQVVYALKHTINRPALRDCAQYNINSA